MLQPLVDSGSLTEEEADAIVAELAAGLPNFTGPQILVGPDIQVGPGGPAFPGREDRGPGRGQFRIISGEVIAEAIGIDVETLREELRSGATVAEIAEANGVDPQVVVDALVADYTERVTAWIEGEQPAADEEPDVRRRHGQHRDHRDHLDRDTSASPATVRTSAVQVEAVAGDDRRQLEQLIRRASPATAASTSGSAGMSTTSPQTMHVR